MRSFVSIAFVCLVACGSDAPEYPDPPRDAGLACGVMVDGGELSCPGDQVCVQGRCYEACSSNAQCARTQTCEEGVCVEGTRADAGMPDAGLCPGGCSGATPECHPTGVCTACVAGTVGECGAAAPICDFAYGSCVGFVADRVCAACNTSADCDGGRTCTERGGERVCLAPCVEGACPRGFTCGADDLCAPSFGTCTGLRNGLTSAACATDADCEPLGATAPAGVCQGASEGVPGACVQACSMETDCLDGRSCAAGYCRPI
ncbi:MAG: hypothetical protein H6721_18835 [Sandaracinus sp.]|nr:hypothetical protein [Sandaracinus sp.]MCB9611126.1 hypothetical protein [Sandaracinus sp.]MCB9623849.1 hypothetical protein [Sandaracinus sp.]MCB9634183.1 hypothetical protein [Sandaracinus sp.]